jgi:hypothetical protein
VRRVHEGLPIDGRAGLRLLHKDEERIASSVMRGKRKGGGPDPASHGGPALGAEAQPQPRGQVGEGRSFAFTPELRSVLERQHSFASAIEQTSAKRVESVFFRPDGTRIKYFRRSWLSACEKARLVAKIPHDFRRTAVRNLARIAVDRKTAMEMVGHKTESIYRRYTITDEAMLRDASARLAVLHEREKNSQTTAKVSEDSAPEAPRPHPLTHYQVGSNVVAWDELNRRHADFQSEPATAPPVSICRYRRRSGELRRRSIGPHGRSSR